MLGDGPLGFGRVSGMTCNEAQRKPHDQARAQAGRQVLKTGNLEMRLEREPAIVIGAIVIARARSILRARPQARSEWAACPLLVRGDHDRAAARCGMVSRMESRVDRDGLMCPTAGDRRRQRLRWTDRQPRFKSGGPRAMTSRGMFDVHGRTGNGVPRHEAALIVGSGSGLSASLARLFAREGMRVGLAARRVEKLGALCEEIGAQAFACDAGRCRSGGKPVRRGRGADRRARCRGLQCGAAGWSGRSSICCPRKSRRHSR